MSQEDNAHRLRAVGHLFEADDEAQEWPELHADIRDARTHYQAGEKMPDWETLDDMLPSASGHGGRRRDYASVVDIAACWAGVTLFHLSRCLRQFHSAAIGRMWCSRIASRPLTVGGRNRSAS